LIINAHSHIGTRKSTQDDPLRNREGCGIDQTRELRAKLPTIGAGAARDDTSVGVQYATAAPGELVVAYAPDPRRPEAVGWLAQARASHSVQTS